MTERRYSDAEAAAIFLQAAEAAPPTPLEPASTEGLTLAALQEIGREAGIAPDAIAFAAQSLPYAGRAVSRTFLGLPIGVERTFALNRVLTEHEWEMLVVELREVFQARGTIGGTGSLRQWTNGNLQALIEPTPSGHRLRFRTSKGDARASMTVGIATLGLSAAVAISALSGGELAASLPGVSLLLLMGAGMFANGALRLSGWAKLRGRQMEGIASRLLAPTATPALPPVDDHEG